MHLSSLDIVFIRNQLHNLNLQSKNERAIYEKLRFVYIASAEGVRTSVYDDAISKHLKPGDVCHGNRTVGIGFNMESTSAKKAWQDCFRGSVSFDAVLHGKKQLSLGQVEALFHYAVKVRARALQDHYKDCWSFIRPNERLAIEDAFYNFEGLVARGTAFHKAITSYYKTCDVRFLKKAIFELQHKSNKRSLKGLQKRRNAGAALMQSTSCPFFALPHAPKRPSVLRVKPFKTVVPKWALLQASISSKKPSHNYENYYMWCAKDIFPGCKTHRVLDGVVFSKSMLVPFLSLPRPCFCRFLPIPSCVEVEKTSILKSNVRTFSLLLNMIKQHFSAV